jgi:hypothetical protein
MGKKMELLHIKCLKIENFSLAQKKCYFSCVKQKMLSVNKNFPSKEQTPPPSSPSGIAGNDLVMDR